MPSSCGLIAHQTLVAAPCSGVFKIDTLREAAMAARCSSSDIDRINSVMIDPGWTENARTRCASPRASSARAKSAFAVLDCPYASHLSYGRRSKCGSAKSTPERRCPRDDKETTRAPPAFRSAGQRRAVSWKWPRWLVASCDSKPRRSRASGVAMIPALFTSMWSGRPDSRNRAANASIEAGSKRSSASTSTRAIPASAARALSSVRAPTITVVPAPDSARVVSRPIPACPPVTMAMTPLRSRCPTASRAVVSSPKPE